MRTPTKYSVLALVLVLLVGVPVDAGALTLETTAADPELEDAPIEARLRVSGSGIRQEPEFPLETVEGSVGETFEMGTLDTVPRRQVDLEVTVPAGRYYRSVSEQELSEGRIELTVYPVGDNSNLSVKRHGIMLQPFPNRLMAREFVVFENTGKTMAGGPDNPVAFDVPEGINRLIPGPGMGKGNDMTKSGDQYQFRNLVPPGESMVGFFYMVQPEGNTFTYEKTATLPTEALAIRVPSFEGLSVSAEDLTETKAPGRSGQSSEARQPTIYRADGLEVGETIRLTFEGLNEISAPGGMSGPNQSESVPGSEENDGMSRPSSFSNVSWPLILGIAFSVLIFVGSYSYVQYALSKQPSGGAGSEFLIREIANLDQEYEDGAIDEAFYKRTRRRWKQKAEELDDDEPA